jgi:hypothetical protein
MVKETNYSPLLLFAASALLFTGGWLMASFPIFIFFAIAPLFAITDRVENTDVAWEKMEWALLALVTCYLAARAFDFSHTVSSLVLAILFTLTLIGQVWVRKTLGPRVGKITILFFWLATEYLLLKVTQENTVFLADALRLEPQWMRWNIHTGFLGASCWILLTNLLVYQSFLSKNPFQWYWIVLMVICLTGPLAYSYTLETPPISRDDMMNLYSGKSRIEDVTYLAQGELVVRTAAWLSILILLSTFVRNQTTKR